MAKRKRPNPKPEEVEASWPFPLPAGKLLGLTVGPNSCFFGHPNPIETQIEIPITVQVYEPLLAKLRRIFMNLTLEEKNDFRRRVILEIMNHSAHRFVSDASLNGAVNISPNALATFAVTASGDVIKLLEAEAGVKGETNG